jgi:hypothetical protein
MPTTWPQFVDLVKEHLTVDANRRGTETFLRRMIVNAVVDLQRFIIPYRDGHTTTYTEFELEDIGQAQLGMLPSQAKLQAFWWQSSLDADNPNCARNRLDFFPWKYRHMLTSGAYGCSRAFVYAVGPMARQFMIYPRVSDEKMTSVVLVWNGLKSVFLDSDLVPWPDEAAEAVAYYVKAKLMLNVDKDIRLAQVNEELYKLKRLSLYRDQVEGLSAELPDEEYIDSEIPVPGSLMPYGDEHIPFLRAIATIDGLGDDAFVTVPTKQLPIPFTVSIQVSDFFVFQSKLWTLKAGSDAHDPESGIVRPNDFDPLNPRTWYLAS